MRRLIRLALILATLWCLWWFAASALLRNGVEHWLDARRAEGWQAEARDISGGGFPLYLNATLADLTLADPDTGVALRSDSLTLKADAWWPGQARVILPDSPITLAAPDRQTRLVMNDSQMRMALAPSTDLSIKTLSWTSGPWALSDPLGSLVAADSLRLAMVQTDAEDTYLFDINMAAARLGDMPRTRLRIPDDWPIAFDALALDMTVSFDRPWDLRALEERRPQPRRIDLRLAEASWGALSLNVAATLDVDASGTPTGDIAIQARDWQSMLTLAETTGAMRPDLRPQAERILGLLAGASGNPDTIDVTLTARNGLLMLGFIPLGPAPQIALR